MKCRLKIWLDDHEGEDTDVILFKDVSLPFFPRKGDEFAIRGCHPLTVWDSCWDEDARQADVCLRWRRLGSWADDLRPWLEAGWELRRSYIMLKDDYGQEAIRVWDTLVAEQLTGVDHGQQN